MRAPLGARILCGIIKVMNILYSALMALVGVVMGSFAGAQVWRLRAHQVAYDKKHKEPYDKHEYAKLKPLMAQYRHKPDRSQCLSCGHTLGFLDLIPLFSWAAQGGRCRYCGARIGAFEPAMELGVAIVFVASYLFWPFGLVNAAHIALFVTWLVIMVVLAILAAYDIKWQLLPDSMNITLIALSVVFIGLRALALPGTVDVISALGAVAILAGLYAAIYVLSKGAWIGLGDVKLGVGLGLILGDWRLGFLALFLANLIGTFVALPGVLLSRLSGGSRIAFGPFLIAGTLLSLWWGAPFISWLFSKSLLLF